MTCLFYISCEKTGIQVTDKNSEQIRITTREVEDCEECPLEYCCCAVELAGLSTQASLYFCGAYDEDVPTVPCSQSPSSPCSSISGGRKTVTLNSLATRELFCVPVGGSFSIYNNGSNSVTLRFTCQAGVIEPDFETITIGSGNYAYFFADGDCILTQC